MSWPKGWTKVRCYACAQFIGMYLTSHPAEVRPYPCPCGAETLVEPPIRKAADR